MAPFSEKDCNGILPEYAEVLNRAHTGPRLVVRLEPPGKYLSLPRPKLAAQLLKALGIPPEGALVARAGRLLTPDCHVYPDEIILVRLTGSRG